MSSSKAPVLRGRDRRPGCRDAGADRAPRRCAASRRTGRRRRRGQRTPRSGRGCGTGGVLDGIEDAEFADRRRGRWRSWRGAGAPQHPALAAPVEGEDLTRNRHRASARRSAAPCRRARRSRNAKPVLAICAHGPGAHGRLRRPAARPPRLGGRTAARDVFGRPALDRLKLLEQRPSDHRLVHLVRTVTDRAEAGRPIPPLDRQVARVPERATHLDGAVEHAQHHPRDVRLDHGDAARPPRRRTCPSSMRSGT